VDRRALQGAELKATREYVAARTATEQQVAAIWAEVLDVAQVGVEENFFELGGHSLLATQVVSRLRAEASISGEKNWKLFRPHFFAWYIAMSLHFLNFVASLPSCGNRLMPTLQLTWTSRPKIRNGLASASTTFSAT
jgi:hypothetical protein